MNKHRKRGISLAERNSKMKDNRRLIWSAEKNCRFAAL
jgi:hypothetical protein